jgi:hypothetical protein
MPITRDENWSSLLRPSLPSTQNFDAGKTEPKTKTTYRIANGALIYGEYDYVEDLEYFDGADESCELVKETWVLVSSEIIFYPEADIGDDEEDGFPETEKILAEIPDAEVARYYDEFYYEDDDLERYLGEQY